jgi:Type II intron maturase
LNFNKSIELPKVIKKNQVGKLTHVNTKVTELKHEKVYSLKLQLIKRNLIDIKCKTALVPPLGIFPCRKQVIAEFKCKSVLNYRGKPCSVRLKTILSDIAIIRWYSLIGKKLLSYYGCTDSFNDLKQQVNGTLRCSLFGTIGVKYQKSISWVIDHFGFNPKVTCKNQVIINFPSSG